MEDTLEISSVTHGHVVSVSDINEYRPGKKVMDFRLRTEEKFPQVIEFTLYDKGIENHKDKIEVGNELAIKFNVKGREYNDRIYHSLAPWSVELIKEMEVPSSEPAEEDPLDEDVPF